MFNLSKPKQAEVLSHWYSLIPNFNTSTNDFYEAVEKELKDHEVPDLKISRVTFSEGGFFSGKREYLRMTRERLVFDICAAPFGRAYFFSCRFAEIPPVIKHPVIAAICERFIRSQTYYRQDTRLLYMETVNAVVKEAVEEATGAKGIKLIRFNEHSPILGELYKPTTTVPQQTPPAT